VRPIAMWKRYATFLRTPPELTIAWHDSETGARAWLIINSSRGGAAGGGTRMRLGLDPREVTYLAKAMELKFALCGPPIGGAKTGIDFDPGDPRKLRVLERWYRAIGPYLRDRYGTGGDLNIDELLEVIPTFERLGLHHPQEGVVRGHLRPDAQGFQQIMRRMELGIAAPLVAPLAVTDVPLTVADMVTGYGVAATIRRYYARSGSELQGRRVLLEGFGNVGAGCALYLARAGARIVAIRDASHTLVDPDGLDACALDDLMRRRINKMLPVDDARVVPCSKDEHDPFWSTPADIFVCAAISASVTVERLERLAGAGVRVIACGANQPFREAKIDSTRVAQLADRRFAVLADIVANLGMARTFSYLMESNAETRADAIFQVVERTIFDSLDEVMDRVAGSSRHLLAATIGLALDRISPGPVFPS
jgi:glutamate dehydrogenase/leucine dehydrogenase